jgi:hypothetical protein
MSTFPKNHCSPITTEREKVVVPVSDYGEPWLWVEKDTYGASGLIGSFEDFEKGT